eukprot:386122-Rhodomonas_salina.1
MQYNASQYASLERPTWAEGSGFSQHGTHGQVTATDWGKGTRGVMLYSVGGMPGGRAGVC